MRVIKIAMVAGMAFFMTIAALNNLLMSDVGLGALKVAVGMETTFKHPAVMWRAITAPWLHYLLFALIVAGQAVSGALCWVGAARMWARRGDGSAFEAAKGTARLGLGLVAAMYFIGWLVIANEWFGMYQSKDLNVLPDAFRDFGAAMLILLFVERAEVA